MARTSPSSGASSRGRTHGATSRDGSGGACRNGGRGSPTASHRPPLTVVGIAYSQGDVGSGNGALLLFTTNMLAILIMGGITFVLTGVTPLARLTDQQDRLRTWTGTVAVAAIAVVGALAINGAEVARNAFEQSRIETVVAEWVEPSERFSVANVSVDGDTVTVVVIGPDRGRPTTQPLADELSGELDRSITVVVRHVVEERDTATGTAD